MNGANEPMTRKKKKLEPVNLRLEWEYFNITKVMDLLATQHPLLPGQGAELVVIPRSAKRQEVVTKVLLELRHGVAQMHCDLTQFDCDVLDAVYTIIAQSRTTRSQYIIFTLEQVVHVLYGKLDGDVTPQQLADVEASLDKLSAIRITIDCTDELVARRIATKGHPTVFTDYLLPVKKYKESDMVASRNGRPARVAYQLYSTPITYMYAEIIGQIARVPARQFEAGGQKMSDTKEMLTIKRYLFRRVAIMSNTHNRAVSRRIAYEWWDGDRRKGMYEHLGYSPEMYSTESQWRKKRSNIHKAVCSVLDWMVKDGTIAGYEVVHAGRKITGVDIILKEDLKAGNKKEAHT